jgi:hypothetical protein
MPKDNKIAANEMSRRPNVPRKNLSTATCFGSYLRQPHAIQYCLRNLFVSYPCTYYIYSIPTSALITLNVKTI